MEGSRMYEWMDGCEWRAVWMKRCIDIDECVSGGMSRYG